MKQIYDNETINLIDERIAQLENENKTMRIGFGKYIAGYRPGDELWSIHDQHALDLAQKFSTHTWPDIHELLREAKRDIDNLRAAILTAASILERDGDEFGVGAALRRTLIQNDC